MWKGDGADGLPGCIKKFKKTTKKIRSYGFFTYICLKTRDMKQRLTAKEEEVMSILWKNGEAMFIRDIVAAMPEPRPN